MFFEKLNALARGGFPIREGKNLHRKHAIIADIADALAKSVEVESARTGIPTDIVSKMEEQFGGLIPIPEALCENS